MLFENKLSNQFSPYPILIVESKKFYEATTNKNNGKLAKSKYLVLSNLTAQATTLFPI
ncbi:hypothetical protein [Okeania sp. SIO2B3]|uniref:hypothetical protein n=1 Tax=Okeania sp. SIO2B3 TaxID=2607784 RepID=UPI0013C0ABF8|nr:hypothetical protein [Okeania sp. SIO2B3]NET45639.1 hypothetical protein [Okeania sp. SIO2B3]